MVDRLANSEANSKRIAVVEGCFGAAGQPLAIAGRVLIGEGVLTKLCRKKAQGASVLPLQRHLGLRQHRYPEEEVQQAAHHPAGERHHRHGAGRGRPAQRVAHQDAHQVLRRLRCHRHREVGVDEPHREMCGRLASEKRQGAYRRARRCLGA